MMFNEHEGTYLSRRRALVCSLPPPPARQDNCVSTPSTASSCTRIDRCMGSMTSNLSGVLWSTVRRVEGCSKTTSRLFEDLM